MIIMAMKKVGPVIVVDSIRDHRYHKADSYAHATVQSRSKMVQCDVAFMAYPQ